MTYLVKNASELSIADDLNPKMPACSLYAKNDIFEEICNRIIANKKNVEDILLPNIYMTNGNPYILEISLMKGLQEC